MSRYSPRWEVVVRHAELNRVRRITGTDRRIVEEMAAAQQLQWDEMWERRREADRRRDHEEQKRQLRADAAAYKAAQQATAAERTVEAQQALAEARTILRQTLNVDDQVRWEDLKPREPFSESAPERPRPQSPMPEPRVDQFPPAFGFLDNFLRKRREKKEAVAKANYDAAHRAWLDEVKRVDRLNTEANARWQQALQGWQDRKMRFEAEQRNAAEAVDARAERYMRGDVDAIEEYVDFVFSRSIYPDWYNRQWEVEYQKETRTLIVDYALPNPEELPVVSEWRYVAARDDFSSRS